MTGLVAHAADERFLQSIFRLSVVQQDPRIVEILPDVRGRYQIMEDGVRFIPHFPLERGLLYRASFDPRPLACYSPSDLLTLEFSLPKQQDDLPTRVTQIFPSCDRLPENLLRFYVCFSGSMQRGRAKIEISLLDANGSPVADALYRAPIELWDGSMRCLTVLLDPGRLKRGVGPNRELGPPLKTGQLYTLVVGKGMTDQSGRPLTDNVYKRFQVTSPVREPIAIEQWKIFSPDINSHDPLVLQFPRPLDRVQLVHSISIASGSGNAIDGRIEIDDCERRWSFVPVSPWTTSLYSIQAAPGLEDVCGNNVMAAFDRPLQPDIDLATEVSSRSIPLYLA
jgi:hypothetical protein